MKLIEKILKFLWILQEKENVDGKLGNGSSYVIRLNPYNPLSYITPIILGVVFIFWWLFLILDFITIEIIKNGITKLFKWH
jgi:hypothetical protein